MGRVLIISYYTPPLGMGGVQRVTKFSKYLPYYGWEPIILTVKPITYYAYDETLLKDLKGIPIYRSESLDPARVAYILSKKREVKSGEKFRDMMRCLPLPDHKFLWVPFAYFLGGDIICSHCPDLIFATYPPLSALLVGLLLKKRFHIPLILDFRDPPLERPPSSFHRLLTHRAISLIRNADGFVALTPKIASLWGVEALILENGFDPEDFEVEPYRKSQKFTIGYMGSLLGIEEETLLVVKEALKEIEGMTMRVVGRVDTRFFGDSQDRVEYYGYLPHREAIKVMMSCDALWLIVEPKRETTVITGKIFEYMAMKRPILATVRESSEVARYIREHRCGIIVPLEKDRIIEALKALKEGRIKITPKGIERFNCRYQTQRLASLFHSILSRYD